MLTSHLHHVLVFLQSCGEFGDLFTQGGADSLSFLQQGCLLSPAPSQLLTNQRVRESLEENDML